MKIYISIIYF